MKKVKSFEIISEVEIEKLLKQLDEIETNRKNSENEEKKYKYNLKKF